MTDEEIKQALQEAVEDIEHELEVSKQFPYLHKPREVAKQLVYRCGYGKVKQYQEEIERLKAENTNLARQLKLADFDEALAALEKLTAEEIIRAIQNKIDEAMLCDADSVPFDVLRLLIKDIAEQYKVIVEVDE